MSDLNHTTRHLLDVLAPHFAGEPGPADRPTSVPRLTVRTSRVPTKPVSSVFEPTFYAVLQGTKVLTMGANRFEMAAGTCVASSFGLPYSHQIAVASHDNPYVEASLRLDVNMLTRVMLDMPKREDRWTCAVAAGDLSGVVGDAFVSLVDLANAPDDVAMLAPYRESELYYRLLQSSMGDTLRQIGLRNDRVRQIKAAADWLGSHNREPVAIADVAARAGMSITSFHRHFKGVTGHSPLAFQRHMRLMEAKKLLAAGGTNVARVAFEVGYQSPSQFSREYKGMFGSSPAVDLGK
jgi:AraC-like DNA-binding protein